MAWYLALLSALAYVWSLFLHWLQTIFISPFHTLDMLWVLVPVWLVWFFSEFFQEKHGTSMGNAITNAVIILWGSIDCARQTTYWLAKEGFQFQEALARFAIIAFLFSYAALIIGFGLKGNKIVKYLGRVREVFYVFIMFVPIFYGAVALNWDHIIAAILFFPLFYYVVEMIDRRMPNPKAVDMDSSGSRS